MEYKYITQDERDDTVAQAVMQREREHYNYELNRLNYLAILDGMKSLPDEWPADLERFKGITGETLVPLVSSEQHLLITQLQFRDRVKDLLATTIAEQTKVESVYTALSSRLDAASMSAAIARVKTKEDAKQAAVK